jgi:MerR family transcriptional regulator, redox-sensitive transcriptional activator SoxR
LERGMAIGAVARRSGINASAIRYYEKAGLLAEPERVNGRRRYGPGVLDFLAAIRLAQRAGFTIAETRTLMSGFSAEEPPSERWRVLAREKLTEVETLIDRAQAMKRLLERGLRCECLTIEDCALLEEERWSAAPSLSPGAGSAASGADNPVLGGDRRKRND